MAQVADLEQAPLERWLAAHLGKHFPALWQALPGEDLGEFIRQALARGRAHGFRDSRHLAHWVNLSAQLGQGFEESPIHPWARAIVAGSEAPAAKIAQLIEAAESAMWPDDDDAEPDDGDDGDEVEP